MAPSKLTLLLVLGAGALAAAAAGMRALEGLAEERAQVDLAPVEIAPLVLPEPVHRPPSAPPPAHLAPPKRPPEKTRPVERILRSVTRNPDQPAFVIEVRRLWSLPIGRALDRCLAARATGRQQQHELATVKAQVDRVALLGDVVAVQGGVRDPALSRMMFDDAVAEPATDGLVAMRDPDADWTGGAIVDGDIALKANFLAARQRDLLDRARDAPAEPAVPSWVRPGDIYGVLPAEMIQRMSAGLPYGIGDAVAAAVERVAVSVDARDEVVVTVDLYGSSPRLLASLAEMLRFGVKQIPRNELPGPLAVFGPVIDDVEILQRGDVVSVQARVEAERLVSALPECRDQR